MSDLAEREESFEIARVPLNVYNPRTADMHDTTAAIAWMAENMADANAYADNTLESLGVPFQYGDSLCDKMSKIYATICERKGAAHAVRRAIGEYLARDTE